MLVFGGYLTATNLLNYLARNLDNILIGWRWGAGALGVYAKAYQLLLLPIRQINGPLTVVAIPALSRLQDQPDLYRLYYQKAIQLLVTIGMPLVVFTFVAADKLILLILGDQWMEAVPIFRMLGPAAVIGTFNVATGWVYISLGQTHRQFRWAVLATTVTIMGFLIGLHWGAIGVAASFSITSLITRYPGIVYGFRRSPLHVRNLLDVLWRPALASAAAGAVIFIGAGLVTLRRHIVWDLLLGLILYTVAYIFTWSVLPNGRRRLWDIVRLASELAVRPREQGHAS